MTEQEFKKLRAEHETAQEELSETRGAYKSLQDRLLREFNLKMVEDGRRELKNLQKKEQTASAELSQELAKYREEFPS